jgi:putative oxidoreductase
MSAPNRTNAFHEETAAFPNAAARDESQPSALAAALPGITLAALRVISALVLLEHSTQRVFGFPAAAGRPWTGAPDLFTRPWFASVLEFLGGTLIVLGLFTRPVAFVLSGLMAFAYFLVHAPRSFFPILNGGEPAVLLCFVFLYLAAAGAGPISLDAILRRRGGRSAT